jgi:hypothetical protein
MYMLQLVTCAFFMIYRFWKHTHLLAEPTSPASCNSCCAWQADSTYWHALTHPALQQPFQRFNTSHVHPVIISVQIRERAYLLAEPTSTASWITVTPNSTIGM